MDIYDTNEVESVLGGALNDGAFDLKAATEAIARKHNLLPQQVAAFALAAQTLASTGTNMAQVIRDLGRAYMDFRRPYATTVGAET